MSRVVSGWVVSSGHHGGWWQAWRSGETRLRADTYSGLLAMIREANTARKRQVT